MRFGRPKGDREPRLERFGNLLLVDILNTQSEITPEPLRNSWGRMEVFFALTPWSHSRKIRKVLNRVTGTSFTLMSRARRECIRRMHADSLIGEARTGSRCRPCPKGG